MSERDVSEALGLFLKLVAGRSRNTSMSTKIFDWRECDGGKDRMEIKGKIILILTSHVDCCRSINRQHV